MEQDDVDYAAVDRERILCYIRQCGGSCRVDDIIAHSGAERLRVYPLLAQLSLEGVVMATEESFWGAPVVVNVVM